MIKGENRESSLERSDYYTEDYFSMVQLGSLCHQINKIANLKPLNILEVGIGNGFTSSFLRRAGFDIVTADINANLSPDIVSSIEDLPNHVSPKQFDLLVCCEVLEHLPFDMFEPSLEIFTSISSRLFLTLPVYDLVLGFGGNVWSPRGVSMRSLALRIKRKKDLSKSMHFWELGSESATTEKNIVKLLSRHYTHIDYGSFELNRCHSYFSCS